MKRRLIKGLIGLALMGGGIWGMVVLWDNTYYNLLNCFLIIFCALGGAGVGGILFMMGAGIWDIFGGAWRQTYYNEEFPDIF